MLNNFHVCGPTWMVLIPYLGALKKWYLHGQWVDVSFILESGPRAQIHGLKSLDRFYDAMLPCPTVLSGKDEFKILPYVLL